MTDAPLDQPSDWRDTRPLSRWERWTTDWNGQPIVEWETEAHARWCEKWAPACPDGNPQRLRHPLGFRERNVGELELRVALGGDDRGVCHLVVEEHDDVVYVRVLICCYDDDDPLQDDDKAPPVRENVDCPVRVWLERGGGDRCRYRRGTPALHAAVREQRPAARPRVPPRQSTPTLGRDLRAHGERRASESGAAFEQATFGL